MSDELKECNILKLFLIVRFACATLDVGYSISSLEKQPFHSAYSLAEILDGSHMTILNHLRDLLGMKLFHLRWIGNRLTEQLRTSKIQKCQELPPLLERMEANKFRNILTDDERWFMFQYQHTAKWSLSREDVSERVRQQIGTTNLYSLLFGK
jgi:hypothetical protein